jgi:excisionase family DNA binding protein
MRPRKTRPTVTPREALFLRPRDVADRLRVKVDVVLGWIHSGELTAVNVAQRRGRRPRWRIDPAAFEQFLLRRSAPKPAPPSRPRRADEDAYRRWGL